MSVGVHPGGEGAEGATRPELRIFLNYRREDTSDAAGRLYDALAEHFGDDHVFMDIDKIDPGVDFVEVVNDAVGSCDVLIALIGRSWLSATDGQGQRRLDNPDDFVRMEVQAALDRNCRVLPVLVQEAEMPGPSQLPESLKSLARRNAIEISHSRWRYDVGRLISALDKVAELEAEKAEAARRKAEREARDEGRVAQVIPPPAPVSQPPPPPPSYPPPPVPPYQQASPPPVAAAFAPPAAYPAQGGAGPTKRSPLVPIGYVTAIIPIIALIIGIIVISDRSDPYKRKHGPWIIVVSLVVWAIFAAIALSGSKS